jgi:hypothetical protein
MPTILRTQVTLPTGSGLPADFIMNTWHNISVDIDPVDDATGFVGDLQTFYNVIDAFMSGRLSSDIIYDVYDLSDAVPRTPIYHFESTLSVSTGDGLPNECAICLSYRGALASGIVPARHRGRIFLGPWAAGVVDQGSGDSIVDVSVRNGIATAAESLMNNSVAGGWPWCVYSPTTALTETVIDSGFQVVAGWVDDAFDTVRSRGGQASARSLFP